jgi:hypothetical protein
MKTKPKATITFEDSEPFPNYAILWNSSQSFGLAMRGNIPDCWSEPKRQLDHLMVNIFNSKLGFSVWKNSQ